MFHYTDSILYAVYARKSFIKSSRESGTLWWLDDSLDDKEKYAATTSLPAAAFAGLRTHSWAEAEFPFEPPCLALQRSGLEPPASGPEPPVQP